MKKILCLLVALACVFSVVSCSGGGAGPEVGNPLEDVVAASNPTKIVTQVRYSYSDSALTELNLDGFYSLEIDGEDSIFAYTHKVPAAIGEAEGPVKTIEGKIYCKDGKTSVDGDAWDVISADTVDAKLALVKGRFKTYEKSEDEKTLNATITGENIKSIIGYAISSDGDISFVLKTNGVYLTRITISYKSISGADVIIDTSYTYNDVELEFPA